MTGKITYLRLRKENGFWVFDDPRYGLVAEPFLEEATAMLDKMAAADAYNSPTPLMAFSLIPHATFAALEFVRKENGGVVYHSDDRFGNGEAWLCPHFWKYFNTPPDTIYVRLFDLPPTPDERLDLW